MGKYRGESEAKRVARAALYMIPHKLGIPPGHIVGICGPEACEVPASLTLQRPVLVADIDPTGLDIARAAGALAYHGDVGLAIRTLPSVSFAHFDACGHLGPWMRDAIVALATRLQCFGFLAITVLKGRERHGSWFLKCCETDHRRFASFVARRGGKYLDDDGTLRDSGVLAASIRERTLAGDVSLLRMAVGRMVGGWLGSGFSNQLVSMIRYHSGCSPMATFVFRRIPRGYTHHNERRDLDGIPGEIPIERNPDLTQVVEALAAYLPRAGDELIARLLGIERQSVIARRAVLTRRSHG